MILTNKIDIISAGLAQLGQNRVQTDADPSRGNQIAQSMWDIVRRSRLASHPWRFAIREQLLTPINDPQDFENVSDFAYMFERPADALLIWGLSSRGAFRTYATQIGAREVNPYLVYIADIEAPALFAPFAEAMMYEVAAAAAIPLTSSVNKATHFQGLAARAWKNARLKDSMQGWAVSIPLDVILSQWPSARGGDGGSIDSALLVG